MNIFGSHYFASPKGCYWGWQPGRYGGSWTTARAMIVDGEAWTRHIPHSVRRGERNPLSPPCKMGSLPQVSVLYWTSNFSFFLSFSFFFFKCGLSETFLLGAREYIVLLFILYCVCDNYTQLSEVHQCDGKKAKILLKSPHWPHTNPFLKSGEGLSSLCGKNHVIRAGVPWRFS